MAFLLRSVLLICFAAGGTFLYGLGLAYLSEVIVTSNRSWGYGAILLQGFLAALLVAVLLCVPLAKVFRQHALYAALAVSLPVLALRVPGLLGAWRNSPSQLLALFEVVAYTLFLALGSWLAHKRLSQCPVSARPTTE